MIDPPEIGITTMAHKVHFDTAKVLVDLKKYLPAQAPLKDFIFQNNLESFQSLPFLKGLRTASEIFGYKVFLSLDEFRSFYQTGRVTEKILTKTIADKKGVDQVEQWKQKLLFNYYPNPNPSRIGKLRTNWKKSLGLDLDTHVHPMLFRIVCSYLDQGISIWNFPLWNDGFLLSVKQMEQDSFTSFFKTKRARKLLLDGNYGLEHLLSLVVGDESLYSQYLFDQQFAHPGWSGIVSVIENRPETLMDKKKISLQEMIVLELLLEIDCLTDKYGNKWEPLASKLDNKPQELFAPVQDTELHEVLSLWQEAFEWTYYDEALAGIQMEKTTEKYVATQKSFQAMFCIDDREISLRDYIERTDKDCETFGTPGFFNVEFYFQPEHGKAYTKLCPAPVTPNYLIKEIGTHEWKEQKDVHFSKNTHSFFAGMIISPVLGFWTAVKLAVDVFKPSVSPASASSFKHMDKVSNLTIENTDGKKENGLQIGFTIEEMATRVEGLLRSVGLTTDFAPLVYMVGHGASSVNNPFYATMDCGACSCRPGSVNARAFCFMANHPKVRAILEMKGLHVPNETQFLGGLHDTTRDEIVFYDESSLSIENKTKHAKNLTVINRALDLNSKERSRRFASIDTNQSAEDIHEQVLARSVSLFEPRPELDHATNALTIIGKREITKGLFLDRRSFLNSYNYATDPEGKLLTGIMRPIAPVCGGINLNYYFARVDNQKLGAGTKLPHNVMGLIGVANGIDGDLRPGLPYQMVEAHDPIRQLVIVEHFPEIVLQTLKSLPNYEWYLNNWMHIIALHPETGETYLFKNSDFELYIPLHKHISSVPDVVSLLESSDSLRNIPVHHIA